ncbi:MAG: hypothetical protein QNJ32_22135 [Xenococcaceae cyanobacterium MO_167.B27]|nr:hypothetical protein [Xenococcaceae cyanobacterium MO_167.B27]
MFVKTILKVIGFCSFMTVLALSLFSHPAEAGNFSKSCLISDTRISSNVFKTSYKLSDRALPKNVIVKT